MYEGFKSKREEVVERAKKLKGLGQNLKKFFFVGG